MDDESDDQGDELAAACVKCGDSEERERGQRGWRNEW